MALRTHVDSSTLLSIHQVALILNFDPALDMDVRDGTDKDRSHLEKCLKELGFHVIAGVNKKPCIWPFQDTQFQNPDRL